MSLYWVIYAGIWAVAIILIGIIVGKLFKWRHGPKCQCGHEADAHQHYRDGTECVDCECQEFHRA